MDDVFRWIETTAFSIWVRESTSIFAFPAILSLHAIGMGLVAGLNAMIDLRLLGAAANIPLAETTRFFPVLWFGFCINAASGVTLLAGYPTKALTNPLFYAKLGFVAGGLITQTLIRRRVTGAGAVPGLIPADDRAGKVLAIVSLICWTGAIFSGRLLAYTYGRLMTA